MGRVNIQFLRRMVRGGMSRKSSRDQIKEAKKDRVEDVNVTHINWAWKYTNENILYICHAETIQDLIIKQNLRWVAHVVRAENECLTKRLMFVDEKFSKVAYHHQIVYENVVKSQQYQGVSEETFQKSYMKMKRKLNVGQPAGQANALGAEVAQ